MNTTLTDLLGGPPKAFQPVAYYDKHMDCIRIELRDCSNTEVRIDQTLTLLRDNDPAPHQSKFAGVMIKGVKHLFQQWEIPMEGVHFVTEIFDRILQDFPLDPENEVRKDLGPLYSVAAETEMSVDLDQVEAQAA